MPNKLAEAGAGRSSKRWTSAGALRSAASCTLGVRGNPQEVGEPAALGLERVLRGGQVARLDESPAQICIGHYPGERRGGGAWIAWSDQEATLRNQIRDATNGGRDHG